MATRPAALGENDNYWCSNPQLVMDFMAKVQKPWIAFKILAAGAIPPRTAFPHAINGGADFILVGMFDWQIEENAKLAKRVIERDSTLNHLANPSLVRGCDVSPVFSTRAPGLSLDR